jgi:hypothetical protein
MFSILLALSLVSGSWSACTTDSPFVGATAWIESFFHGVQGRIDIVDDCSFVVTAFNYDGQGPSTAWVAATGDVHSNTVLQAIDMVEARSTSVTVTLPIGVTWASLASNSRFVLLSVYCSTAKASFGSARLRPAGEAREQACSSWVGATAALSQLAHGVAGTVTVRGDCTLEVTGFSYDGASPDPHWFAEAPGLAITSAGSIDLGAIEKRVHAGECAEVVLPGALNFDQIARGKGAVQISVWCKQASANFGSLLLTKPSVPAAATGRPANCRALAACSDWAGASGTFTTLAHNAGGVVTLMADCTFVVSKFSSDGLSPDPHFMAASKSAPLRASSLVDLGAIEKRSFTGTSCTEGQIGSAATTWATIANGTDTIQFVIWCKAASALFASVNITKPAAPDAVAASQPASCRALACRRWAGASGTLSSLAHGVAGSVAIFGDCTWMISNFSMDGMSPDPHVFVQRAGAALSQGTDLGAINNVPHTRGCIGGRLPWSLDFETLAGNATGLQWSVWCKQASANFGDALLARPAAGGSAATTVVPPSTCKAAMCDSWAGASGTLSSLAHGVAGTVTIRGDCSVLITGFSSDGMSPDPHFYAERAGGNFSSSGSFDLGAIERRNISAECATVSLGPAGTVVWNSIARGTGAVQFAVWCKAANALFGVALLTKPAVPSLDRGAATCDRCGGWAGASAYLSSLAHGVGGRVRLGSDCSFVVENLTYDGASPDPRFFAESGGSSITTAGSFDLGRLEKRAYAGECVAGAAPPPLTFDDMARFGGQLQFSVWCAQASALFGVALLEKPSARFRAAPAPASCTRSKGCAEWVGATGALRSLAHGVAGTVTIRGDCSIQLTDFSYDGKAPDPHVYVEADGVALTTLGSTNVTRIANRAYAGECLAVRLAQSDFGAVAKGGSKLVVSIWCAQAAALFADVTLSKPAVPDALLAPVAKCASNVCPARAPNCLKNCAKLRDNMLVWWQREAGGRITIELEADVADDSWVAFGVSSDGDAYGMVDSDVVVTGIVNGVPKAVDFYMTSRSQCNYASGANQGVCPDNNIKTCTGAANPNKNITGTGDVTVISGARVGTLQRVRFQRLMETGDVCDRAYTASSRIVWGAGPASGGAAFVVNTHGAAALTPAGHGHGPITGPLTRFDFTASPGVGAECLGEVRRTAIAPESKVCVPAVKSAAPALWKLTVENSRAYPNPPAWGVSWRFNGIESPELVLQRGVEYTFAVAASSFHPFYIVDNEVGGMANASEVVFAGGASTFGTDEAPFMLKWTPTASTPDRVFYQCTTHQKLGWVIHVADSVAGFQWPASSKSCESQEVRNSTTTGAITTSLPSSSVSQTETAATTEQVSDARALPLASATVALIALVGLA